MHTLLLLLAGPMQSWGTESQFKIRETNREPSKSAIIGLCCAALGRRRSEDVEDLAALQMGVRIEKEGNLEMDYQTAMNVVKATGKSPDTVLSDRHYLSDAKFLVGLAGDDLNLLTLIHSALKHPKWPLFLGRKSYTPSIPVYLEDGLLENCSLIDALTEYTVKDCCSRKNTYKDPKHNSNPNSNVIRKLLVLESSIADADQIRNDQPIGAAFESRKFSTRGIKYQEIEIPMDTSLTIENQTQQENDE